jgi:hypothetical protein
MKNETKPKKRFMWNTDYPHAGSPWKTVIESLQRNAAATTRAGIFELVKVAEGTPAELAALPDPDEPKIEVVDTNQCRHCIRCGDHVWGGTQPGHWTKDRSIMWSFDHENPASAVASLLRMFKHFPPVDGGGA